MGKKYTNFQVNLEGLENAFYWYTIVTQYNYEQKVTNDILRMSKDNVLKNYIEDAFCGIVENKIFDENGKEKIKSQKVISNYVFVKAKMNVKIWFLLNNITGVSAVLCTGGMPVFTSEKKIIEMKNMLGVEII